MDVWDAMTTDRPYRPAMPEAEVLEHIKDNSGKLFDPSVVKNFVELMEVPRDAN